MITEEEVMRLLERADPAQRRHNAPIVDAASHLDALRTRSKTAEAMTVIELEALGPTETRRERPMRIMVAGIMATACRRRDRPRPNPQG